jgi:CRAL/TRIO domain
MTNEATASSLPDIYGQIHPIEYPELFDTKHDAFFIELAKLPSQKRANADMATQKCPELITKEFIRMFLRCEVFNADLAARRYTRYWDKRVEVFGETRAFQPLTADSLNEEDIVALSIGYINIVKRPNDRTYVYIDEAKHDGTKYARHSMLRAVWFVAHKALSECEDLQKRGLVVISYAEKAKLSQFDRKLDQLVIGSIRGCLPVRLSGIHLCHPPDFFRIIWPIIKVFLSKRLSQRLIIHAGSHESVAKALTTKYSFQLDDLPSDVGGSRDVFLNYKHYL